VEVVETGCGRSGSDFSEGLGSEGLSEGGRKILNRIWFRISGQSLKISEDSSEILSISVNSYPVVVPLNNVG
jgi:hypothetical protein